MNGFIKIGLIDKDMTMLKKIAFFTTLIFSPYLAALTCPTAADILNNKISGWKAYDIYGVRFSEQQIAQFRQHSLEFAVAEVIPYSRGLAIRCLYRDKNGSNLQGYLAKDDIVADNSKNYWYEVSGSKHCAAGLHKCQFAVNPLPNKQFAKR